MSRTLKEFYRGQRILVTGHTGFTGGWLCACLKEFGAEISGLALAPEAGRPSLFETARVAEGTNSHIGDLRHYRTVSQLVATQQPEIIFHLAAQPLVRRSYLNPIETYETNVLGTVHILEAARACPSVRAIVVATTDKCYHNAEWVWGYRETDRLGGKDPYSSSKACAELVAETYRETMFPRDGRISLATARGGNIIGGGDWSEDRLVPDTIRALLNGTPIVLRNPQAVRPWQHVLELVRGYLMLGCRLYTNGRSYAGCWNFGPPRSNEISVETLARKLAASWGIPNPKIEVISSDLKESTFLRLDSSKAEVELGWSTLLSLDDTIALTASWYQAQSEDPAAARALVDGQIKNYFARVVG